MIPIPTRVILISTLLISSVGASLVNAQTPPERLNWEVTRKSDTAQNVNTPDRQQAQTRGTQLLEQAGQLLEQGTVQSQAQAIANYEQALKIWQDIGERSQEASTLLSLGTVYYLQSNNQKALDYFNQGLIIRREIKDSLGEAVALTSVANAYSNLGQKQKAIDFYNQALQLFRAQGKHSLEASVLHTMGNVYSNLGQTQLSLNAYSQALAIQRTESDRKAQAETLTSLGRAYANLGENQKAVESLNQALALQRAENDLPRQADTLTIVGTLYMALGETQLSLESFNQALELRRAAEGTLSGIALAFNRTQQALTLSGMSGIYRSLGQPEKAIASYDRALELLRSAGDLRNTAEILNQVSFLYDELGEKQKALDSLNAALAIQQQVKDLPRAAFTLGNLGGIYLSLGEPQKALDAYNQGRELQRQVGDVAGEASTLKSIAQLYSSLGDYQFSVDTYNQALSLFRSVGDRAREAQTLENIGSTYRLAGDNRKAIDYYNQALALHQKQGDRFQEIATLTSVVRTYESLQDYTKALDAANQALLISRQQKIPFGEGAAFAMQGRVYLALGDYQKALDSFIQAQSLLRQVGLPLAQANVLDNLGKVYDGLKQPQQAIATYNSALSLRRQLGDRTGEAETLYLLAQTERDRNNLEAARTQIESTIAIVEDVRTKVTSQELRTSYFSSVQKYYQFYIDLLMQRHKKTPSQGYDALALQASERARARSLIEILTEANATIRTGVNPKLREEKIAIEQQLDAIEKRRVQLLSSNSTRGQTAGLDKETSALLTQYQALQEKIRTTSPRYAALTQPKPLALAEIQQQVLDEDTLLLEYSLGEERSYLWAVTKTGITSYELPKRAEIEAVVKGIYEQSGGRTLPERRGIGVVPRDRNNAITTQLSQILLSPVAGQLGNKRLVIVSDGALQYVPFAALPAPDTSGNSDRPVPLIVKHEIVNLPSASTLAVLRQETQGRSPATKTIAVLADPVFSKDDERVKTTVGANSRQGKQTERSQNLANMGSRALERSARALGVAFNRLPFTRQEADRILALVPAEQEQQALDFAASRAFATSPQLSDYRIVHFATHGILNSQNPELSGIVLSLVNEEGMPENGFLRLPDIFNLNLSADLVVLSACETGLGQEVKGEGLVGLTRGFMYAGAPRVLVSLWSVDDEATSELMSRFYKKMFQDGQKPAAALRAAQIEMLQDTRWQEPYYWAAFTLQGEWR